LSHPRLGIVAENRARRLFFQAAAGQVLVPIKRPTPVVALT
jgi:hypothetical protein